MAGKRMVKLKTSDAHIFEVDKAVASESGTIKNFIEDLGMKDDPILLPEVSSKILPIVIKYCRYHVEKRKTISKNKSVIKEEEALMSKWDAEFMKAIDQQTLFDLMMAVNYMHIQNLLDLTCQTVANMIKEKSVEDIRKVFNIQNDFTPVEEVAIREETQWASD